ncbi:hypothetical protein HanIR_Chr05g0229101 [Helianthus annuus]|nr:hypothetical protein HanIR_Chr05g0229101 [Helianthus annuus]
MDGGGVPDRWMWSPNHSPLYAPFTLSIQLSDVEFFQHLLDVLFISMDLEFQAYGLCSTYIRHQLYNTLVEVINPYHTLSFHWFMIKKKILMR